MNNKHHVDWNKNSNYEEDKLCHIPITQGGLNSRFSLKLETIIIKTKGKHFN